MPLAPGSHFDEEGESTGISTLSPDAHPVTGWYTLDGRHLNERPVTPGLYIHSGHKVFVK